jgi:hypothetical protein
MSLSFIVTGTIWRWMLQPKGGVNRLPTLVGLPAGRFAWLTSRQQILQFDWNRLPVITALVVAAVLVLVGGLGLVAVGVGVVEASMARLRMNRVPQFLVAASALATFGVILLLR